MDKARPINAAEPMIAEHEDGLRRLPVLPLTMTVLFPHALTPLLLGYEHHDMLDLVMATDRRVIAVGRRTDDEHAADDLHGVGVEAQVVRVMRLPDGSMNVLLRGVQRVHIHALTRDGKTLHARYRPLVEPAGRFVEGEALRRVALRLFEQIVELSRTLPETSFAEAQNAETPGALADIIAANLPLTLANRQHILETLDATERLHVLLDLLRNELDVLRLEHHIRASVEHEIAQVHRDHLLREQLRAIQRELGQHDPAVRDRTELADRVAATAFPPLVHARALDELHRLELCASDTPEYTVIRTYLDWLLSLPWHETTHDTPDLGRAERILDEHHYGLRKVKDRILEHLAVHTLVGTATHQPILCFVGPPGVGKTSLGRAVAAALGRRFVRIALGGIRDEAEIRGHRRTYVGALPGRIIKAMREAGTINPVVMLDEVDKLSWDVRGDPSAALLEVLDNEQNRQFSDHYLDVPYDLSQVLFITTANILDDIEDTLLDRLEVIELPSYTEEEKLAIARRFLIPRQIEASGLAATPIQFTESTLRHLIRGYTFEAGVRQFERDIGALCRNVARKVAEQHRYPRRVLPSHLQPVLGPPRFDHGVMGVVDEIGVATGLVWTEQGGDVMPIEISVADGKGNLTLTGQLGDIMQESAQAALSWLRVNARRVGVDPRRFDKVDIHIHAPEGSVPKEGPSAGITIACALVSALGGRAVRRVVAMTGEVTLRGHVLPVGGVKEKVLGAYRAGITHVIVPRRNERDLVNELSRDVVRQLTITYVATMDEVLPVAFVENPLLFPYKQQRKKKASPRPRPDDAPPSA